MTPTFKALMEWSNRKVEGPVRGGWHDLYTDALIIQIGKELGLDVRGMDRREAYDMVIEAWLLKEEK